MAFYKENNPSMCKTINKFKPTNSISTCTEMTTEDTNVPTQDDQYPWLDPDDK